MSIGSEFNLFEISANHAKKLSIQNPVISNEDLDKIKFIKSENFKSATISTLYEISGRLNSLENALEEMILAIEKAIDHEGANIIILSSKDQSLGI